MFDVAVYGATGYTGRLVCPELVRRGVSFSIAGRDARKLEALARTLPAGIAIDVAPLDHPAALERMARRARVVLDCAGPFARYGRPVLDAALLAGAHFLDITGEQLWMRETFERDGDAKRRGVALINSVGFDVVPTDAAAALAAEAAGAPIESVAIAFTTSGTRPTQGTTRSSIQAAHLGGLAWRDGGFHPEPVGAVTRDIPFPPPFGMRTCTSVPWGDVATAPRSTGAREVRTFFALSPRARRFVPIANALGGITAWDPVQNLLERYVRRLPEGPTPEQRARGHFAVWAEAIGSKGTHSVWVTGNDGYDFTAASASLCAQVAASKEFAGRGALTPSQAFGAKWLLDSLADAGVKWGVGGK
jgi:short subunit dehydrogenase-like uncharacterized protein